MGPRLGSRGKGCTMTACLPSRLPSMGPRLGSRGKMSSSDCIASLLSPFNGATTGESWKVEDVPHLVGEGLLPFNGATTGESWKDPA